MSGESSTGTPSFQPFSLLRGGAGPSHRKSSSSRPRKDGLALLAEGDRSDAGVVVGPHEQRGRGARAGAGSAGGHVGGVRKDEMNRKKGKNAGKSGGKKGAGQTVDTKGGNANGGAGKSQAVTGPRTNSQTKASGHSVPSKGGPSNGRAGKGGAGKSGPSKGGPSKGGPSKGGPSKGGAGKGGPSKGGAGKSGDKGPCAQAAQNNAKKTNRRKNKNKKKKKNKDSNSDNLAVQVFQEPLMRLAILRHLNPHSMDDMKAIISLKQLGLLPTDELRYYLNTCVPDDYVATCFGIYRTKLDPYCADCPISTMIVTGRMGDYEWDVNREVEYDVMMATEIDAPMDAQAIRYYLQERMDIGQVKDVLRDEVLHKEPNSARKWLKGKKRPAVWNKYGFLSYIPKRVYNCIRPGQRAVAVMRKKEFTPRNVTRSDAADILATLAAAGCPLKVIDTLIRKYGADLDPPSCGCIDPALRVAAINGHTAIVEHLVVRHGIDPLRVPSVHQHGNSLAHFAAISGRIDTLRLVCGTLGVNPDIINDWGQTPVHTAAAAGSVACVKYLVDEFGLDPNVRDVSGHTPAMFAAMAGSLGVLEVLAEEYGYDMRTVDGDGGNVLHWAMTKSHAHLIKPLVEKYKLDVNGKTKHGQTPAHYAVMSRSVKALQELIDEHGADPKAVTKYGSTLAHFAALYRSRALLRILFDKYSLDPSEKTEAGDTCADWADVVDAIDICEYLEEKYGIAYSYSTYARDHLRTEDMFGLTVLSIGDAYGIEMPLSDDDDDDDDDWDDDDWLDIEDAYLEDQFYHLEYYLGMGDSEFDDSEFDDGEIDSDW